MREIAIAFVTGGITFTALLIGGMLLARYVFGPEQQR